MAGAVSDMPVDPISELAAAAARLHELYLAFLNAGFSDVQAFELVKAVVANR